MFKAKDYQKLFTNIPDHPKKFPQEVYRLLEDIDILQITFPTIAKEKGPSNGEEYQPLFDLLFEMGRGNLSLGRIIEGHINALMLIDTFGTSQQKDKYFNHARKGALFGVWNTENPQESVKFRKSGTSSVLSGAKSFCTGALNLDFAIVTAHRAKKTQMLIVDVGENPNLKEDWSLWDPIGMKASVSCRIDFTGTYVRDNQFLGKPQDYYKEPIFSWGGARFSAVQFGGARHIVDNVLNDLSKRKRTDDPYQKYRLGKMAILMKTAELWISEANQIQQKNVKEISPMERVNFANMMRSACLEICEEIISIAEKAVGVQGIMLDHPLEQTIRDLRVYLKQAGPDAALVSVGHFITNGKKQR